MVAVVGALLAPGGAAIAQTTDEVQVDDSVREYRAGVPTDESTMTPAAGPKSKGAPEASAADSSTSAPARAIAKEPAAPDGPADPGIVGGTAASTGAYPSFVSLQYVPAGGTPLNKHFCGGTLIARSWVLTAAHCVDGGLTIAQLDLLIGNTLLTDATQGETRDAAQIIIHPSWNGSVTNGFDVALVRLATPSTRTWARMALAGDPFAPGQTARAVGHGYTFEGGSVTNELRQVDLPVQSDATMTTSYGANFKPATMIGAGPLAGGMDTCQGDSGGPLYVHPTALQPAVVGDTSWGTGCARPNLPGIYGESWQGSMRTFVDTHVTRPNNDNFGAVAIAGANGIVFGNNQDATGQVGEPTHAGSAADTTVWYNWTAPGSGPTTLNLRDAAFDTTLAVYTGNAVNALTAVSSNDDFTTLQSKLTFNATAGTLYRIAVDGFSAQSGPFGLQWSQNPPANDDFAAATVLTGTFGEASGSTVAATGQPGEPSHGGSAPNRSVWYGWTAPESGAVVMNTKMSDFDTTLAVYTGNSVTGLTLVAQNDDFTTLQSRVAFTATSGTDYKIAVAGWSSSSGQYFLEWTINPPSNDNFATPKAIGGLPSGSIPGTTVRTTGENGEPDFHGGAFSNNSAWFSWSQAQTAPALVRVRGLSPNFFPGIEVYTGNSLTNLVSVGSGSTEARFTMQANTLYRIAVDGNGGTAGSFTIEWILGRCNGLDATIIASGTVNGTAGDDVIVGSLFNDLINGLGGNDTICGLSGADQLYGGDGVDRIFGGDGNDLIDGGMGNDVVRGEAGNDTFVEGTGSGNGTDVIDGGPGIDLVKYDSRSTNLNISLDNVANDGAAGENDNVLDSVENVRGGVGNDVITGSAANNVLYGGPGVDQLRGLGGDDTLQLGDGAGGDFGDGGAHVAGDTCTGDAGDTIVNCP